MPSIQTKINSKKSKYTRPKDDSSSSSSSEAESEGSDIWTEDDEDDSSYIPSSSSEENSPKHAKRGTDKKNNDLFSEKIIQSLLTAVKNKIDHKKSGSKKTKGKHVSESEDEESEEDPDANDDEASSSSDYQSKKSRKQKTKKDKKAKAKKSKKEKAKEESVSEEDDQPDDDEESEHESEEEDDTQAISIVYTVMGEDELDIGDYYGAEEDAEILAEDENEECNSEDEKTFIGENYETVEPPEPLDKKNKTKKSNKKGKKSANKSNKGEKGIDKDKSTDDPAESELAENAEPDIAAKYKNLMDLKRMLVDQISKNPTNKQLRKTLKTCEEDVKKLIRKSRHSNTKAYHKLVHNELQQTNELEYFKKKLSNSEQRAIMRELKSINDSIYSDKPQRLALLQSTMVNKYKAVAMQRLNKLLEMDRTDNEYHKLKYWVDNFMRIPFGIYRSISVSLDHGTEVCNQFMVDAKSTLDKCVYGLNDAKMQIMQMLGQWVVNPSSVGTAIAIHGPPGTGKTSIVKDGISKILGREFAFIALGGCGDSSFLEGHSYTYEGSLWGKIVQILMDSKCMNPVIYFDELDKVSDTPRGQEIIGVLTHLTDTSQNSEFHDKYFSEVSFDLSKCLFIFSYNDESLVNPILKDRMYRIQTKGYDAKEKIAIARNYLLPRIREQVCFKEEEIVIPDETLKYIIGAEHLTKNESGVRNLKRCLEIIYTKLNLFRLVKPDSSVINAGDEFKGIEIKWPFTVTRKEVDVFIKNREPLNPTILAMYL